MNSKEPSQAWVISRQVSSQRIVINARRRWSADNLDERWQAFTYDELIAYDKDNLDIFWLRDESLEDMVNLPEPDVLAMENRR